ncbi:hypothetical protein KGF56_002009 [Candida oxycetoniae]|uniref:Phosphatidic acid phosphatase type 2/haloperoxidase domain-containing protein n=1 Tax=Candida oxycetoniae TaxID=497107 RepID=A0AAI9SY75_9ASCO|nr:uncharacterized protein KGF56_002009 [Candida oxycetoniae]KAI3405171.2 hypothetical protein KGF56_002009 [Candida oxycetoniae]
MVRDWAIRFKAIQLSGLSTISYVFDFVFYSTILALSVSLGRIIPPRFHEFSIYDISIRYTYIEQVTVPVWLLVLISAGIPSVQFIIFAIITKRASFKRRLWDIFAGNLCLLGAQATQIWTVVLLKNITGLPRPDVIDRCEPMVQNIPLTQLSNVSICTQPNWNIVMEGFRSFPSGHASTVYCGMIITSLNFAAHLQAFDQRNNSFKVFLTIVPLLGAAFVASTRVSDNRHYLRDVIAGSIIGTFVGLAYYHQYHPSVFNLRNKGRAFPPRRFGINRFLRNIGGFWSFGRGDQDIDMEAVEARAMNNDDVEKRLPLNENGDSTQVNNLSDNIKYVNAML